MIYSIRSKRNEVAYTGKCIVVSDVCKFFGGDSSQPYASKILINPTWADLFACAKAQQKKTRDMHHVFFEGYITTGRVGSNQSIAALELLLGS
jgi:hypothetical protein